MRKTFAATTALALAMSLGMGTAVADNENIGSGNQEVTDLDQTANGGSGGDADATGGNARAGGGNATAVSVVDFPDDGFGPDQQTRNIINDDNSGQQVQISVNGQNQDAQFDEQIDSPDELLDDQEFDEAVGGSASVAVNQSNLLSPSLSQVRGVSDDLGTGITATAVGNNASGSVSITASSFGMDGESAATGSVVTESGAGAGVTGGISGVGDDVEVDD